MILVSYSASIVCISNNTPFEMLIVLLVTAWQKAPAKALQHMNDGFKNSNVNVGMSHLAVLTCSNTKQLVGVPI